MEVKSSIPDKVEEHHNVTTEHHVNEDGTTTTSEVTTTMKKTTKINYDAAVDAKTFVYETDKAETKYFKALELKNEVAIFITDKGNRPVDIIELKSFEKIMNMVGTSYKVGYDMVVYSIYSMEEIYEFKRSIKNNTTGKENNYVYNLQKIYEYSLPPCKKFKRIKPCDHVMELVAKELQRLKDEKKRMLEDEERRRKEEEDAKIKADQDAERRKKEEEERKRKEEEDKKRAAEEAEKKKLADEAEKKRLEEEAEKKRLAEEAEKKRLADEAEKKRLEEEAEKKRLEEEAEKKRLEEEAEKKRLEEEAEKKRLAEEAEKKRLADEAEKKRLAEEAEKKRLEEEAEKKRQEEEEEKKKAAEAEAKRIAAEEEERNKVKEEEIKPKDQEIEDETQKELLKAKKPKKKFRASEETDKDHPDEVLSEEIISEDEFIVRKKRRVRTPDGEEKEEIIEEKKVTPFVEPSKDDLLINKIQSDAPKTNLPVKKHPVMAEDQSRDKTKDASQPQISETKTTTTYKPKKPVKSKPRNPDTSDKVPVEEEKPKKKIVKKIIKKVKPTSNSDMKPFVSSGGYGGAGGSTSYTGHVCRSHCVICKGLPVKPQECSRCHKQYCSLCTYELSHPNHCAECDGLLERDRDSMSQTQTFESNITRYTPKKEVESDNKYQGLSAKDFYEKNRDRYINDKWKEDLEKENEIKPRTIREKRLKESIIIKEEKVSDITDGVDPNKEYYIKDYCHLLDLQGVLVIDQNEAIWSICYVPNTTSGKDAILTGHAKGNIFLWDIEKSSKIKCYFEHTSKVYDIKLIPIKSEYKTYFASVSEDRSTKIWDLSLQNSILSISSLSPLFTIDVLNENVLITGDKNKNLSIYHISIGKDDTKKTFALASPTQHMGMVWRVLILKKNPQHRYIISAGDKTLMQHELSSDFKKISFIKSYPNAHKGLIHDIIELTDNKFATCSVDHFIKIWDTTNDTFLKEINYLYDSTIFSMIYMNDYDSNCDKTEGDVIVCGGYDKKMKIVCQDEDLRKKVVTYGEYDRPEALYKMRMLYNNKKYKFAAINFGCSANLYFWGVKNIE